MFFSGFDSEMEFFPYHRLDLNLNHHASACCVIFLRRCNRHIYHTHSHHAHTYHIYLYIPERELTTDQCVQLGEPMRFFFWANVFLLKFLRNMSEELLMRRDISKSAIYIYKSWNIGALCTVYRQIILRGSPLHLGWSKSPCQGSLYLWSW